MASATRPGRRPGAGHCGRRLPDSPDASGAGRHKLETHAVITSRDCEPPLPRRYRYQLARIEDGAGHDTLETMLDRCWRLWEEADSDKSLSSSQLAAVATPAAMQCLWDGHNDQARKIASAVLRTFLRVPRASLKPIDRLRAVACALVVSVCDQEAETWWPFLAWASAEMYDAAGAEDGARSPAFLHWKGVAYASIAGWAAGAYAPVIFDILPFYAGTYEDAFLKDEYLATDMLDELARGFTTRGLYDHARLCLSRAFWLGRVGLSASQASPSGEPESGFRTRLLTTLLIAALEEWTGDPYRAQQWYGAARALTEVYPHLARRLPPRYAEAIEAGMLRSRLHSNTVVLFTEAPDDFDDDASVGASSVW
ncbi:hypothetical protein AURDEDRAFT_188553 [Auricularia subglabra TFB-10046 SS5]|uniref:Uncharacterized protein n=1 Tax=Auricularia subglabra (strain TFB-10046 / SS5) TaxID=717982 RepID=J0WSD0_AURST|nr:hypothetical protein AURDEDRAFT_188553 [Auricularia subglabra TFB-10046 SS5]